jgi:hypothetical protein
MNALKNAVETDDRIPALAEADTLLDALGDRHTFQTFDDTGRNRRNLIRILHGALTEHTDTLARLNDAGAGIFVMVNGGDGKGRNAGSVQRVRAVFADLDGAPLIPVLNGALQPHIVVESSPGRWHAYWLAEGVPLGQFKGIQQAIAARYGSDPKVCDLPRVMRLPGFLHNKAEPFRTRIVEIHAWPPYSHARIVDWLGIGMAADAPCKALASPLQAPRMLADAIPKGERNSTLFALACGLVRKGIDEAGVNDRLQRINAERCQPPLGADEVDVIVRNASVAGSKGFALLPHTLLDSPEWKALPAASCAILLAFYRCYDGSNNGRLAVPWSDFQGRHGIDTDRRFYRYLRRVVDAGLLTCASKARNGQKGRIPAMYGIPKRYLAERAQPSKQPLGPTVKTTVLSK